MMLRGIVQRAFGRLIIKQRGGLIGLQSRQPLTAGIVVHREYTQKSSLRNLEAENLLGEIYQHLSDEDGLEIAELLAFFQENGVRRRDLRIRKLITNIESLIESGVYKISREQFIDIATEEFILLKKAFTGNLIIPEFSKFTKYIDDLYWECKSNTSGQVASYIPQLARYSADYWSVSVCTTDGQRHSIGDLDIPFCLQSCSKPLAYAMSLNDLGADVIHQYVGQEPSGQAFNSLALSSNKKPHNPMINAGAIVVCSLLKNNLQLPDRFDYFSMKVKATAGGEYVGFHNSTFLSERATADRNKAIGWFMKENQCFPVGTSLDETLDLYFQICSLEVNTDSASVIAATIANGGICPTTSEKVLTSESVRNTLSLMYSCGMYDYSGQFAFKVGLPAKSGVSGCVLLVVPNVMGIALWSPALDNLGNSTRAVQFCQRLVEKFNFHNYDSIRHHTSNKSDPRNQVMESSVSQISALFYSAYNNDIRNLMRQKMSGMDMNSVDYDKRTALHIAASEGHLEAVKYLVDKCHVKVDLPDRWGQTSLDNAQTLGNTDVIEFLSRQSNQPYNSQSNNQDENTE